MVGDDGLDVRVGKRRAQRARVGSRAGKVHKAADGTRGVMVGGVDVLVGTATEVTDKGGQDRGSAIA